MQVMDQESHQRNKCLVGPRGKIGIGTPTIKNHRKIFDSSSFLIKKKLRRSRGVVFSGKTDMLTQIIQKEAINQMVKPKV